MRNKWKSVIAYLIYTIHLGALIYFGIKDSFRILEKTYQNIYLGIILIGAVIYFSAYFKLGVKKSSGGMSCLSIAWIMIFLPKHRVRGWLLSGIMGISMLVEVFLITMQTWRSVPSHFNFSTTFDAAIFTAMGILIVFVEIVIIVVMFWSFFSLKAPSSMAWAIRVGLVILVISQVFGNLIIQNGIPKVIDFETGKFVSEGLSSTNIFGASGLMKIPHALSLHAVQVLPALAWLLLFTNWSEGQRIRTVMVAIVGYSGLMIASAFQTFRGLAPFEIHLLVALVIGVSLIGVVGAYIAAFIGLRKTLGQTAVSASASNDKEEVSP